MTTIEGVGGTNGKKPIRVRGDKLTSRHSLKYRVARAVDRRLRPLRIRLDRWFISAAARSGILNRVYYTLHRGEFRREQRAVIAGLARFARDVENPSQSVAMLRRNTHRLEKGLLMRPRRPVFALDYIEETVAGYRRLLADSGACDPPSEELVWAHDVLEAYFDTVEKHPKIDRLREEYCSLPVPGRNGSGHLVPYRRDLSQPPSVDYDALLELSIRRRSVRWFLPTPVPREAIDRAIIVAGLSPSACNRQPFAFRVFDNPELAKQVARLPYGAAGYSDNIPVIIVVVGRLRCYFDERDRHLIYVDGSLASMSLLYALESQGLSSCCINWPDIPEREQAVTDLLGLEPDERVIMFIAVGYPDPEGLVACSQKKPLDQLRRYNFE